MPTIRVNIVGDERGLTTSAKRAEGALGGIGEKAGKLKGLLLGGLGAAGVIELGKSIAEATGKEETANAKLAVSLKNAHSGWTVNSRAIEDAVKTGEKYGHSAAETKTAIAALTTAVGPAKAIKDLSLAQDLAAKTGKPLEAAAIAIAKAQEGQLKPLKQLGIDLPVAAGGSTKLLSANTALQKSQGKLFIATSAWHTALAKEKALIASGTSTQAQRAAADKKVVDAYTSMQKASLGVKDAQSKVNTVQGAGAKIIDLLGQKIKGSANAQAETFAGKVKALRVTLEDLEAKIGEKVIPILEKLGSAVLSIIGWFEKGSAPARALEAAIVGIAAAFAVFKTAQVAIAGYNRAVKLAKDVQKAWNVVQAAFNAIMDANPIVLAAAAIVALGIGIYEAYKHFKPFREVVDAVWHALSRAFNWVRDHWKGLAELLVLPFAPFLLLFDGKLRDKVLGGIENVFGAVTGFLKSVGSKLLGALGDLGGLFVQAGQDLLSGLVTGAKIYWKILWTFYVKIPEQILKALAGAASWLLGIGGDIIRGLWAGAKDAWKGVLVWFNLEKEIAKVFATAATWLLHAGTAVLTGLWNGAKTGWTTFFQWVNGIEGNIVKALASAGSWLISTGGHLLHGLYSGATSGWNEVAGFLRGIAGKVVGAVGGLGSTLVSAGSRLIHGLWDGIKSAWNWLADHTTFHLPSFKVLGHTIGGGTVSLLPHLARGGVVDSVFGGQLAVLGEGGRREAVLPLPHGFDLGKLATSVTEMQREYRNVAAVARGSATAAPSGPAGNVYITLPAGVDPEAVVRAQRRYDRRNGTG